MKFSKLKEDKKKILLIDTLIIILSIIAAYKIMNVVDIASFIYQWVIGIDKYGFLQIYEKHVVDYPPLIPFWLFLLKDPVLALAGNNEVEMVYFLLKLLPIIVQIISTIWIYNKISPFASLAWTGNIAIMVNCYIWGQADCTLGFLILLLFYYFDNNRPYKASIIFAIMCLFKHQGLYFVFPYLVYLFISKNSIKTKILSFGTGVLLGIAMWMPFIVTHGCNIFFPLEIYLNATSLDETYSYNASNFWYCLNLIQVNGIASHFSFLLIIVCVIIFAIIFKQSKNLTLSTFIYLFSIFMITFNQHERYIFYAMVLLFIIIYVENRDDYKGYYYAIVISAFIVQSLVLIHGNYDAYCIILGNSNSSTMIFLEKLKKYGIGLMAVLNIIVYFGVIYKKIIMLNKKKNTPV